MNTKKIATEKMASFLAAKLVLHSNTTTRIID